MWILFSVPCPTPDGRTAEDLYQARVERIDEEVTAEVEEAVKFAEESPDPDPRQLYRYVYTEPEGR